MIYHALLHSAGEGFPVCPVLVASAGRFRKQEPTPLKAACAADPLHDLDPTSPIQELHRSSNLVDAEPKTVSMTMRKDAEVPANSIDSSSWFKVSRSNVI